MKIKNLAVIILAAVALGGLPAFAQTNTNAGATNAPATNIVVVSTNAAAPAATNAVAVVETNDAPEITTTNALRMNFHDVPLNTVLTYLSARMGFVINTDGDVHGKATMVSEQPIGTNEVLQLLSAALAKNNYAVTRDGRILNITAADTAKTGAGTPVHQAATPAEIPVNDEMATYILPVHTLNPTQLIKDLDQLIPSGATVAANEAGNAVIMTARQKDIHRFSEIINALDSSSVAAVGVFVLKYADAKSVADELKEIFQSPDSTVARSDSRQRFRGFGGGFPSFGGGGEDRGGSGSESKNAANKAIFTSDDQRNAVIASAPPDYFPEITNVIDRLDQPSSDITEIHVFRLKYADAQETADLLANLFPDETTSANSQSSRSLGSRFFTPPWMQQPTPTSTTSDHMKRQATVRAVPDLRTASLIVTTSRELMEQVKGVIEALDSNPAMVQHVFSYDIDNADPVAVQAALTALFAGPNTKTQSQSQNTSALSTREQSAAQQQSQSTTTSGFGSGGGGTSGIR